MSSILIVDDEEKLSGRVWSGWRTQTSREAKIRPPKQQVTSWRTFVSHVHEHEAKDIVVLNLEALNAPSLQEAIRLREKQPKLKFLYVVNINGNLSERTMAALSQPDITWASSEASAQELGLRLRGLMKPSGKDNPSKASIQPPKTSSSRVVSNIQERSPWEHLMPDLHNPDSGRLDAAR